MQEIGPYTGYLAFEMAPPPAYGTIGLFNVENLQEIKPLALGPITIVPTAIYLGIIVPRITSPSQLICLSVLHCTHSVGFCA